MTATQDAGPGDSTPGPGFIHTGMRRFRVYRHNPPEGYREAGIAAPPELPQFEGIVFSDGTVCVRWQTAYQSHSIWADLHSLRIVHGHPEYGTVWEWIDDDPS